MSDENTKFVSRVTGGRISASKWHGYRDCSVINHTGRTEGTGLEVIEVSDREADLLGLRECSLCQKRRTGGPAIEALKDILLKMPAGPDGDPDGDPEVEAWYVLNALKERGFYIAQRGTRQAVKSAAS